MGKLIGRLSPKHMVKRIFIAVFLLIVFFMIFFFAENSFSGKIREFKACRHWIWEHSSGDPADVLFVGTSRTKKAIDLDHIRLRMQQLGGVYSTIDRLETSGPDQFSAAAYSLSYLKSRGVPKVVIIENMFTVQKGTLYRQQYKPDIYLDLHGTAARFTKPEQYRKIQSQLDKQSGHTFKDYFDTRYVGPLEFRTTRIKNVIYDFLSSPLMVSKPLSTVCEKRLETIENREPGKHIEMNLSEAQPLSLEEEDKALRRLKKFIPINSKDENRHYDIALMQYLISIYRDAGVESVIVWFPSDYRLDYDKQAFDIVNAQYTGIDKVLYKEIVDYLSPHDKRKIFWNANHLNEYGARLVSNFWIQELISYD